MPEISVSKTEAAEGRTNNWGEVVTRYPYENVGMDHLLSKEKKRKYKKRFSHVAEIPGQF